MSFRALMTTADHAELMVRIRAALASPEVPLHLRGGLERYFDWGILPGGFLQAVLCQDLDEAIARADPSSIRALPALCIWLTHHAPAHAWGSRETVLAWTTTPDRLEIAGAWASDAQEETR